MVLAVDLAVMLVVLVCGVSGLDIAWCGLLGLTVVCCGFGLAGFWWFACLVVAMCFLGGVPLCVVVIYGFGLSGCCGLFWIFRFMWLDTACIWLVLVWWLLFLSCLVAGVAFLSSVFWVWCGRF